MSRQIIGRQKVWAVGGFVDLQGVLKRAETHPDDAIGVLAFTRPDSMMNGSGWIHVGWADVAVTLVDEDAFVQGQVASIDAEINAIRQDTNEKIARLEDRRSKLTALTYEEAA